MSGRVVLCTNKPFAPQVTDDIVRIIREAGRECTVYANYDANKKTPTPTPEMMEGCEAIIIRSDVIKETVLNYPQSSSLKLIVRAGAGTDNVDKALAGSKGVAVQNTPGTNSNATAELAISLMLFNARNQLRGASKMGYELKGKKLGLYGFGNVARCVARIAQGFGMDVCTFDVAYPENFESYGVRKCENLEGIFEGADFVSIHVPDCGATRGTVNKARVSLMKPISFLVNTARGPVVNEAEILEAMQERPLFHYSTDVSQASSLEWPAERYYCTPVKQGAQTEEANTQSGIQAAEQVAHYLRTGAPSFRLN
eukprot:gnl/Trimastix_PCT/154.p2 GENE.gnl/Trimastix_PCT/154~~gnl/Trimastix_PCT/154.p2  ORF type:complete len:312 (+),score=99.78 gnl/Trimastix_PCT/154:61-996(+)